MDRGRGLQLGVEHEYRLWRGTEQLDFRQLISTAAGELPALDPGDPRARRLPSGVALTADGLEAELATPPLPVAEGVGPRIDELLRRERTELRDVVAPLGLDSLTGFSTHLNITVPDDLAVPLGRRFAETCSLALAAVTEGDDSLGVFVRPRRGRLEYGGEYVEGPRLMAALTLVACCVAGLQQGRGPTVSREPALEASREKFGWFVPPDQLDPGALEAVWQWARPRARELGLDPGAVDDVTSLPHTGGRCTFEDAGAPPGPEPAVAPRDLPVGLHAATEWLTWTHAVWVLHDRSGAACRAVVPAASEQVFLDDLAAGQYDGEVLRLLRTPLRRRRLLVNAQLPPDEVSLWHDVRPGALVPAERLPDGTVPRVSRRAALRDLRRSAA